MLPRKLEYKRSEREGARLPSTNAEGLTVCPACRSSATFEEDFACTLVEFCMNCGIFWEKETRSPDKLHTPCDNCAFRPNSPERADPEAWAAVAKTVEEGLFLCHKRVPAVLTENAYEFKCTVQNANQCMGWLASRLGKIYSKSGGEGGGESRRDERDQRDQRAPPQIRCGCGGIAFSV